MMDIYSKTSIAKRLQGKRISDKIRKGLSGVLGLKSVSQIQAKKKLALFLSSKSKRARDKILRSMKMDYRERGKFESSIFGEKKISVAEQRRMDRKAEKIKKRNIASSRYYSEKLANERAGKGSLKRSYNTSGSKGDYTRLGISDKIGHSASARGPKRSTDDVRRNNVQSLSKSSKATSVASGIGSKQPSHGGRPLGF